jgi:hypothetical protein
MPGIVFDVNYSFKTLFNSIVMKKTHVLSSLFLCFAVTLNAQSKKKVDQFGNVISDSRFGKTRLINMYSTNI